MAQTQNQGIIILDIEDSQVNTEKESLGEYIKKFLFAQ